MEPRSTMLAALAQPKEREKLLRLEQELTRLVNNPSQDRLDMQPMSLHNRTLVHGVAEQVRRTGVHLGAQLQQPALHPCQPARAAELELHRPAGAAVGQADRARK